MAIYAVSDLHGAATALEEGLPKGATLLLLGDLLNVIDYTDMTGILVEIFSVDAVAEVVHLRTKGDLDEARRVMRERSAGREDEIRTRFAQLAAVQYEEVFAALPDPTYVILGNVDVPPLADGFAAGHPHVAMCDASVVELEGERFGFAGGALPTPLRVAGEVTQEQLRAKIEVLGPVDVLCTHIPPAIPDLCYDTLAKRHEQGSSDVLEYILDTKPRLHYFGHVHQPLVSSMRVGDTTCINVGYFRSTKRPFPHLKESGDGR